MTWRTSCDAAVHGGVGVMVVSAGTGTTGAPATVIAGAGCCADLPASRRAPAAHRIPRQPGGRFDGVACGQQDDKPADQPVRPPARLVTCGPGVRGTPPGPPGAPLLPLGQGPRGPGRTTGTHPSCRKE